MQVLRNVGIKCKQMPAEIDEDKLLQDLQNTNDEVQNSSFAYYVRELAIAKGRDVARKLTKSFEFNRETEADELNTVVNMQYSQKFIIIACDSMFEFDGRLIGKPKNHEIALHNIIAYSGKSGILHTGHAIIVHEFRTHVSDELSEPGTNNILNTSDILITSTANTFNSSQTIASETVSTIVNFAKYDKNTAEDYLKTGEPQNVAGAFKIDAKGSALIDSIDGDYYSVVGVSPACIRRLCVNLNIDFAKNLWR